MKQIEFTEDVKQFLIWLGYSHILSIGAEDTENGADGGTDNYWLEPIKPTDPRLTYEEADHILQSIYSNDVMDMAMGVNFICFMMKIPESEYEIYKMKKL